MHLNEDERAMLQGDRGPASALAMGVIVQAADSLGAERLVDVSTVHCCDTMFIAEADLEFARRLTALGARPVVPTTLNSGSCDLVNGQSEPLDPVLRAKERELMALYSAMGGEPTFTCAPFQERTVYAKKGDDVVWSESSAIPYVNSVIGARTNRYGSYIDICASITGKAPYYGLHLEQNRLPQVHVRVSDATARWWDSDLFYALLGYVLGDRVGAAIPLITGLPTAIAPHRLKAFGASAATSGAVTLFHIPGVTAEASEPDAVVSAPRDLTVIDVKPSDLTETAARISSLAEGEAITTVALGAPHLSITEIGRIIAAIEGGFTKHSAVSMSLATSRSIAAEVADLGWAALLEGAGIRTVCDRCTYFPGILGDEDRRVVTDSAKWATYGPGHLGVRVAVRDLDSCLDSAASGVVRGGGVR